MKFPKIHYFNERLYKTPKLNFFLKKAKEKYLQ